MTISTPSSAADKLLDAQRIAAVNAANGPPPDYFRRLESEPVPSATDIRWQQVSPGASGTCFFLYAHPTVRELIFLSNDMGASYRSEDAGESWHSTLDCDGDGLTGSQLDEMAFSPLHPSVGYAGGPHGLLRSEDYGKTWQPVAHRFGAGPVSAIAIDSEDDALLFVGTGCKWRRYSHLEEVNPGGLFRSGDGGRTWRDSAGGIDPAAMIVKLLIDPFSPPAQRRVFAATTRGFYVSEDHGRSWRHAEDGLPHGNGAALAAWSDPRRRALRLFLALWTECVKKSDGKGTRGGVFRSDDGGARWTEISGNLYFDPATFSPARRKQLQRYLSFGTPGDPPPQEQDPLACPLSAEPVLQRFNFLYVHPRHPDTLRLGAVAWHHRCHSFDPCGIWQSDDGGRHWHMLARKGRGWQDDAAFWQTRGQATSSNVDMGYYERKFSAHDLYTHFDTRGLTVSPVDPDLLFFSSRHIVCRSTDGGASWRNVDTDEVGENRFRGRGNSNVGALNVVFDARRPRDSFLLGQDICLAVSVDEGATFTPADPGAMMLGDIDDLAFDPDDPDIVYTGKSRGHPGCFFRSDDGGRSFRQLSRPVNVPLKADAFTNLAAPIHSVLIDPDSPRERRRIFLCSSSMQRNRQHNLAENPGQGVLRSEDGGASWQAVNAGLGANLNVSCLVREPHTGRLLAGVFAYRQVESGRVYYGGLFDSADKGASWRRLPLPDEIVNVQRIECHPRQAGLFHLACGHVFTPFRERTLAGGAYRSEDGGRSWTRIFHTVFCNWITADPNDPERVYVAATNGYADGCTRNPGIYRSRDGGRTWQKINRGLASPNRTMAVRCHPLKPGLLWCASNNSGWYVSHGG